MWLHSNHSMIHSYSPHVTDHSIHPSMAWWCVSPHGSLILLLVLTLVALILFFSLLSYLVVFLAWVNMSLSRIIWASSDLTL